MSELSYNDLMKLIPKARPKKILEPPCDPILEHCIKLRKFYNEIDKLVLTTANLKEIYEDSEREPILRALPPVPELPEFNDKISNKDLKNLECEIIELSEDTVTKLVSKAIARIMFVLGYTGVSSHLLNEMSKMIVDYVKSLSETIVDQMSEDGSVSVDLLEGALQQKGIRDIEELHSFYTQRIKFHDGLYMKCKHLCQVLKNNLKKPNAPLKQDIIKSSKDEKSAINTIKGLNIEENSTKNCLHPEMLTEDLFINRKLKKGIGSIITENRNSANHKDLCESKIDSDEAKSPEKNHFDANILAEDLFVNTKLKQKIAQYANKAENGDNISHKYLNKQKMDSDKDRLIVIEKNTLSSDCFSNPESEPIKRTNYLEQTKTDSNLSDKSSHTVSENSCKITNDLLSDSIYYSHDKLSDCAMNNVTNESLVPNEKVLSYFDNKQFLSGINTANERKVKIFDEEMVSDKVENNSTLIHKSSGSIFTNEENSTCHNVISESYSNPENISLDSTETGEPNVSASLSKKISNNLACNSSNKLLSIKRTKKKSIESLDNNSIGNKKKRPRLIKQEKVLKNGVSTEEISSKIRFNSKNCSNSITNCNKFQENDTISEENSYISHNPEVSSRDKIIKPIAEGNSSSENDT